MLRMKSLDRISGYGHIALRYGLEEAIFLDSIMFWYKENRANGRNYQDGRWWTYNSVSALAQLFPWWSAKQLRRISESCREQGAILTANFNENQRDRTLWYTPGDELLELYGMADETREPDPGQFPERGTCIGPNGPTHLPERANTLAQTGKCNIEHVNTSVQNNMDTPTPPKYPKRKMPAKKELPSPPSDEVGEVLDEYAGEDRELRERLEEFRESRKRKKKPLQTRRAARILADKLDKLSERDRAVKLALLDNAILHGWDSVYPLKEDEKPGGPPGPDAPLRNKKFTYI